MAGTLGPLKHVTCPAGPRAESWTCGDRSLPVHYLGSQPSSVYHPFVRACSTFEEDCGHLSAGVLTRAG